MMMPDIPARAAALARLEPLAANLTALGWQTELAPRPTTMPALSIRDGAAGVLEEIYAVELGRRQFYWWTRACGADPASAAHLISGALRGTAS
jgi:hypothetical protein